MKKHVVSIALFFLTIVLFSVFFMKSIVPQASAAVTFVSTWGTVGNADGQFNFPQGIATDNAGNVYVADSSNGRIQKFDSDGVFITKWGSPGTGDGEFSDPVGISFDNAGNIYVADSSNARIQKFDSDGVFITKWGSPGTGDGQFDLPFGTATDSIGNVYVIDSNGSRLQKFDSNGVFITKWGSAGSGDGQFSPLGISIDSADKIYISDALNNRIQKFDSNGVFITKWGSAGTGDGQFSLPAGNAINSVGDFYTVEFGNHRVQKFDNVGTFLTKWGSSGSGDGQFNSPRGIATNNSGYIYVADTGNDRVQKFFDSDAVPTPTPPPAPQSNNGGGSVNNTASAPTCSNSTPIGSPNLFQVDASPTQAILFFVPVGDANNYFITYGYTPGDMRFGVELQEGQSSGAISYTLNTLSPNSTYYIRVRAGNGCMPGNWGNEMKITTAKKGNTGGIRYYKNFLSRIFSVFPRSVTTIKTTPPVQAQGKTSNCEYTVQPGDSLWGIAQSQLGQGSRYQEIQKSNSLSSTLIHSGQKLTLGCSQ